MKTINNIENINLIRSMAWSYYRTTGIDYEDLFSEALLAACEASNSYNNNMRAKKTTYMWCYINSKLAGFIYTESRQKNYIYLEDITYTPVYVNTKNAYEEFIKSIPDEYKELIDEIIDDPHKYETVHKNGNYYIKPKLARGILYRSLREKGWSNGKIWKAIRYMKESVNKMSNTSII